MYALIRTTANVPDYVNTFDTKEAAVAELAAWTDPMKADPDDYWNDPVVVERTETSTIIRGGVDDDTFIIQRYDVLEVEAGI